MKSPQRRQVLGVAAAGLLAVLAPTAIAASRRARPPRQIPRNYLIAGAEHGVPPALLFSVALQESSRLWKTPRERTLLPWPWTLNIARTPYRAATQADCLARILYELDRGQRSIDIGLMQVSWKYHAHRFASPAHALDPFVNLHVGASLLAHHYAATGQWLRAVARYHNADPAIGGPYAASVFRFVGEVVGTASA